MLIIAGGNYLPLGDPRDQTFIRRVVRATISDHRSLIIDSFTKLDKPFIVNIDFCDYPYRLDVCYSQNDIPRRCVHMADLPPPVGWVEAWNRATDCSGFLVVRSAIPVGRRSTSVIQVMSSHPFRDLQSKDEDAGLRHVQNPEEGQDEIVVSGFTVLVSDPRTAHTCSK